MLLYGCSCRKMSLAQRDTVFVALNQTESSGNGGIYAGLSRVRNLDRKRVGSSGSVHSKDFVECQPRRRPIRNSSPLPLQRITSLGVGVTEQHEMCFACWNQLIVGDHDFNAHVRLMKTAIHPTPDRCERGGDRIYPAGENCLCLRFEFHVRTTQRISARIPNQTPTGLVLFRGVGQSARLGVRRDGRVRRRGIWDTYAMSRNMAGEARNRPAFSASDIQDVLALRCVSEGYAAEVAGETWPGRGAFC